MLSPKWFSKKLYNIIHFVQDYYCEDECDYWEDCGVDQKTCIDLKIARSKHKLKKHVEFYITKLGTSKEYLILDEYSIMSIQIGKPNPHFTERIGKPKMKYIPIKCKDLKYCNERKNFRYNTFQWGKNWYSRNFVYFAFKCLKDHEILAPWIKIGPLVIRNDKCTINIAPRVDA